MLLTCKNVFDIISDSTRWARALGNLSVNGLVDRESHQFIFGIRKWFKQCYSFAKKRADKKTLAEIRSQSSVKELIKLLDPLVAIVPASLVVFFGFYLSYYMICLRNVVSRHSCITKGFSNEDLPMISIIVPVYNESRVISAKIENLKSLNYPHSKLEAVFVDGGSIDGTSHQIEDLARNTDLSIKLITQGSRKGFNSAVIDGFAQTVGEIIFITGAETEYESESLNSIVRHFADPEIGAVTGRQRIKNLKEGFSPQLEGAYRDLYDFIRKAESNIDSPFDLKGEISAARRCIVKELVENPKLARKGCIDACFSFQGKLDGYKTIYEPNAVYYELSPRTFRDSFKQQIRRAATLIENMLVFKKMILNKAFGPFGLLIMPAHFLMLLIMPYLFLIASIGIITLVALNPLNYLFLLIMVGGLSLIVVSKKAQAFVKTQLVLILATLKLLRGVETQKFERLQSARPISLSEIKVMREEHAME